MEINPDVSVKSEEEAYVLLKLERTPGSHATIQKDTNFTIRSI